MQGIWKDCKKISALTNEIGTKKRLVSQLSLEELEVYFERWNDIKNLIPLLVIGVLPFGNGAVALLA